jgi:hypothetical protein
MLPGPRLGTLTDVTQRFYRIRIRGTLGERFAAAFEPLDLEPGAGVTVLSGVCVDPSALYGVLDQLRDLGIELLDVQSFAIAPAG